VIRLPSHSIERSTPRPDFATQTAQQSYTRPRPGIVPGGLAYASSWGMDQRLASIGHLQVQNGRTVVVLHS
jgi:hypothetical protein